MTLTLYTVHKEGKIFLKILISNWERTRDAMSYLRFRESLGYMNKDMKLFLISSCKIKNGSKAKGYLKFERFQKIANAILPGFFMQCGKNANTSLEENLKGYQVRIRKMIDDENIRYSLATIVILGIK